MKNSFLNHLQFNIDVKNRTFYKELMACLGWSVVHEDDTMLGFKSGEKHGSLWFLSMTGKVTTDYDQLGMNHVGIGVEKQADVDKVVDFLKEYNVNALFDTPRHRAEFSEGEGETYYQVMFTSSDNILFEVVYIGTKA